MSLLVEASDSVNSFCLKLFSSLAGSNQNVFFSPTSIYVAIAMTYAGAGGKTAKEIKDALGWNAPENVHEMMQKLQKSILSSSGVEINLANRLWLQQDFAILRQFGEVLKSRYEVELGAEDFEKNSEKTRKAINQWVEEKTNAKIKDILESLASDTKLVLVNAVHFKGFWEDEFLKNHSVDWDFNVSSSQMCKVTLMNKTAHFMYAKNYELACQVVELKYKQSELAMMVVLPDDIDGLASLEKKLTLAQLKKCATMLAGTRLRVSIPKFTADCKFQLKQVLGKIGIVDLFSCQDADLSGITGDKDLFVTEAIHQAFVDVNEQGTEAAAATVVTMAPRCIMLPPPHFLADHPFLFFIQHCKTRVILFAGKIVNPEYK